MRALLVALVLVSGCASAQKDTMMAEVSLSSAISLAYRTVDGVDKLKTDAIAAEFTAGQVDKAKSDYRDYKPEIEKARNALNVAEDVLEHADEARAALSKGGKLSDFTQWLPALIEAGAQIQKTIADVKELLK